MGRRLGDRPKFLHVSVHKRPDMGHLSVLMLRDALRDLFDVELLRSDFKLGLHSVREPKPKATPKEPNDVDL